TGSLRVAPPSPTCASSTTTTSASSPSFNAFALASGVCSARSKALQAAGRAVVPPPCSLFDGIRSVRLRRVPGRRPASRRLLPSLKGLLMLVPLSWLRDFAPFGDDYATLGETFDDLGMVVEGINVVGEGLDGVVVARVASIEPIKGADKIRKIMADVGEDEPMQVACGDWNSGAGHLVPGETAGAT